jgi:hypothetical protein
MPKLLWTERTNFGLLPRSGHATAFDVARTRVVLFGGRSSDALLRDTWEWDGSHWTQVSDIGPPDRGSHGMAYDGARKRTILFGGISLADESAAHGDTWMWDGENWTQLSDGGPSPRSGAPLAYDSIRQRIVLFGGMTPNGAVLSDTWEFDGEAWAQVEDTGPDGRAHHGLAFHRTSGAVVLFGGINGSDEDFADTWMWNGTAWSQHAAFGPAPRSRAPLVAASGLIELFGGATDVNDRGGLRNVHRDTWGFDGRRWTQLQDIGPSARFGHAMAYDEARDRVMLFGGLSLDATGGRTSPVGETWEHAPLHLTAPSDPTPPIQYLDGLLLSPSSAPAGMLINVTIHLGLVANHTISVVLVLISAPQLQAGLDGHVDPATILQQGTLLTTVNVPPLVNIFATQISAPPPAGQFAVLAATNPGFFVYAALDVT